MRPDTDVDDIISALEICSSGRPCDSCPFFAECLGHPSSNTAMNNASEYIRERRTRRLTPNEMIEHHCHPIYIITNPPDIDEWFFYVGHVDRKGGLFLFRNSDGKVHDFWECEYGKTWLAFNGEVTDKLWKEAKKEMEGSAEK